MYFAYRSNYSIIIKAAQAVFFLYIFNLIFFHALSLFHFKFYLFFANCIMAKIYWDLSDDGWFSVPLYFLEIGLIWALYYFLTVAPDPLIFAFIYNRFADLANFFIIGCSIYRIRALKRERAAAPHSPLPASAKG